MHSRTPDGGENYECRGELTFVNSLQWAFQCPRRRPVTSEINQEGSGGGAWMTNTTWNREEGRCEKAPSGSNFPYLEVLAIPTYQIRILRTGRIGGKRWRKLWMEGLPHYTTQETMMNLTVNRRPGALWSWAVLILHSRSWWSWWD